MTHTPNRVALGLGANLGDPPATFMRAVELLAAGGFEKAVLSPLYQTVPVECEPGAPPFCNAALTGDWPGGIAALLDLCQAIERQLGRPAAHLSRESRPIDIDILLAGERVVSSPRLRLPHPRLRRRLFVLIPLRDIAPDWPVPPGRQTVAALCERLLRRTPAPGAVIQPWPATRPPQDAASPPMA
ncbi:MAG: 2-amino-4-hydroxy-6-hydroxymethyldihydropteridine pyrophosphokinase [Lentisphaerae bacterium ADurb.BinA184]|nr:MAG: 2-amino-4-hydroxy-6-hydroxymethyldihydropteridine pyrophosphokinase [Lentisphaerae bacterium ADurb.BinA184]